MPFHPPPLKLKGAKMKEIKLTQGKVALVDDEDFEELNRFKWQAHKSGKTFYAARRMVDEGKRKFLTMHQSILNPIVGFKTDHKDGNGLHNWRSNLRYATHSQNVANAPKRKGAISIFKGVSPLPTYINARWVAYIRVNGEGKYLGCFANETDAAVAYDKAAREFFGEFARTNF